MQRTCRQAHATGAPLATQPPPVKACLALSQAQPYALYGWMSAQALPLNTSMGAALTLALHATAGTPSGSAGLG